MSKAQVYINHYIPAKWIEIVNIFFHNDESLITFNVLEALKKLTIFCVENKKYIDNLNFALTKTDNIENIRKYIEKSTIVRQKYEQIEIEINHAIFHSPKYNLTWEGWAKDTFLKKHYEDIRGIISKSPKYFYCDFSLIIIEIFGTPLREATAFKVLSREWSGTFLLVEQYLEDSFLDIIE